MTLSRRSCLAAIGAVFLAGRDGGAAWAQGGGNPMNETVTLPAPGAGSGVPVEQALARRRSVRDFADAPLTVQELSTVLWAAQGRSHARGYRTAPSAGALFPLELYVLAGNVSGLAPGVYKYQSAAHELVRRGDGDLRADAARAALGQSWIADGQAIVVIAAVFRRTTARYGRRGMRYVHMEAGHAAQNVYLQATALDLGTTVVGAFDDSRIHALVGMARDESPLSLMPLGQLPA